MAWLERYGISGLGMAIWLLAALFFLYEFFLRAFVGTMASQIMPDLHLTASTFSMMGSAYYFTYGFMQIPVGVLADRFGVRAILSMATLVCVVSVLWFSSAHGMLAGFLSRMLMGFGSSFAFICLLVVAVTWFPRRYFGFCSGASQFVGTVGPLLAGGPLVMLLNHVGGDWRHAMVLIAAIGALLAVAIFAVVRDKPRLCDDGWVIIRERQSFRQHMRKLLTNSQSWSVGLYTAFVYEPIAILGAIWGTSYLQAHGFSQGYAATTVSLTWLAYAVACPLLGIASDLTRRRRPLMIACALLGFCATALLAFLPCQSLWVYALLFSAVGVAAAGQNLGFAIISEHVAPEAKAASLGFNNAMIGVSGTTMPVLVGYLIEWKAGQQHLFQAADFTWGFSALPVLNALGLLMILFFVRETYCRPQREVIPVERSR